MDLKNRFENFKTTWAFYSFKQKIQFVALIVLVLGIPAIVGAVSIVRFYNPRASQPITPPITPPTTPTPISTLTPTPIASIFPTTTPGVTPQPTITYTNVNDTFDGNGAVDLIKIGWSSSVGGSALLENDQLKLSVAQGHDGNGGNDITVIRYINSFLPQLSGDFDVSVDLAGLNTQNGWQELRFVGNGGISVRRNKITTTETLEVWTRPANDPTLTKNVSRSLPLQNNPLKVKLQRIGNEMLVYYFDGNTYINILDMAWNEFLGDGLAPQLGVENNSPDYPQTTAFFDNYIGHFNFINLPTPKPSSTPNYTSTPTAVPTPIPACNIADINKDGVVNQQDVDIVTSSFFMDVFADYMPDINHDGIVDIMDYSIVVANLNNSTGGCQ